MRTAKNLPIPERMKRFPLWNGFPVHFTVFRDKQGVPDFQVMYETRRIECFRKNWCHLCGRNLAPGPYHFIGSEKCIRLRAFIDGPMHIECAEYAAKVCPFLSSPSYHGQIQWIEDDGSVTKEYRDTRPNRMALAAASRYVVARNPGESRVRKVTQIGILEESVPAPLATDPTSPAQLVCHIPDEFLWINWDLMPQKELHGSPGALPPPDGRGGGHPPESWI